MTIQDRLERRFAPAVRKLFDRNVRLAGITVYGVRLRFKEDMYSDEYDSSIVSRDPVVAIVDYPSEIPLHRIRDTESSDETPAVNESGSSTGVFFYEILPIELYTRWSDNVMRGDILVHEMEDEQGNMLRMRLRVTEDLGHFRSVLTWKKHYCAPYNGRYNEELDSELEEFEKTEDMYDLW